MAEAFTVRREIQIAAPQAAVFAFLTDPEKIIRWVGTEATVEPHLDGLYLVSVGANATAQGQIHRSYPGPPPRLQLRLERDR